MGGAWVHWLQPYVLTELRRYGIATEEEGEAREGKWVADGVARPVTVDTQWAIIVEATTAMCRDARTFFPAPHEPLRADIEDVDRFSIQDRIMDLEMDEGRRAVAEGFWSGLSSAHAQRGGHRVRAALGRPGRLRPRADDRDGDGKQHRRRLARARGRHPDGRGLRRSARRRPWRRSGRTRTASRWSCATARSSRARACRDRRAAELAGPHRLRAGRWPRASAPRRPRARPRAASRRGSACAANARSSSRRRRRAAA